MICKGKQQGYSVCLLCWLAGWLAGWLLHHNKKPQCSQKSASEAGLGWAGLGWLIVALLIFNMATDEDSSSAVLVGESLGQRLLAESLVTSK